MTDFPPLPPAACLLRPLVARIAERLGRLHASFPVWRFLAMRGVEQPSLLEHFGMRRLVRATDVRDPTRHEPERDEFGTGFYMATEHNGGVEFRRAYLASLVPGGRPAALVVRNDSRYFGHNRLPERTFVRLAPTMTEALQAVRPEDFLPNGLFLPWRRFFCEVSPEDWADHLERVDTAVSALVRTDAAIAQWLSDRYGGLPHLVAFLAARCGPTHPRIFLTRQRALHEVAAAVAVDEAVCADLARYVDTGAVADAIAPVFGPEGAGFTLVLASGPQGDGVTPIVPDWPDAA